MAILQVKDLFKSFGKTEVLKDINFTLEKGEVLGMIGSFALAFTVSFTGALPSSKFTFIS